MAMSTQPTEYGFGNEVIRSYIDTIKGGVVLDVTDYTEEYIQAGHLIIRDSETQKTYKPMPVSGEAYDSLPAGYEYAGVLIATIPTDEAFAAVLTIGEVNEKLIPYPISSIKSDVKAALPTINWAQD